MTGTDVLSTLPDALDRIERTVAPDTPLLLGARTVGYGDVFAAARRLVACFRAAGLGLGDRVLVAGADEGAVAALLVAGLRSGVAVVVADPGADLGGLAGALGARAVFAEAPVPVDGPMVLLREPGWLARLTRRVSPTLLEMLDAHPPVADWPAPPPATAPACVLFTAGRHAAPRPVAATHGALAAAVARVSGRIGLDAGARLFNPLPLHHAGGLVHGLLAVLLAGGTLVRPWSLELPAGWLLRHRVTHLVASPALLAGLEGADATLFRTGAFRLAASLGAGLDERLWRVLEARFGISIVSFYGPAETLGTAFAAGPDESHRFGTIGRPLGCDFRIADDKGHPVPVGAVGELLIRDKPVTRDADSSFGLPGWLPTGDRAAVDADGFVTLLGRTGAAPVGTCPERTAAALRAHPDVAEAAVVAGHGGLAACVALRRPVPVDALREHLRDLVPPDVLPDALHVLPALPRDALGGPDLRALAALAVRSAPAATTLRVEGPAA